MILIDSFYEFIMKFVCNFFDCLMNQFDFIETKYRLIDQKIDLINFSIQSIIIIGITEEFICDVVHAKYTLVFYPREST